MFIGVLYHRFRWGISFSIRFKSRSISTFSFASANVILLFSQGKAHPLQKTLTLLACKSSGTLTQQEAFCKKLPKSSCTLRKGVHRRSIPFTSRSGCSRALQSTPTQALGFMMDLFNQARATMLRRQLDLPYLRYYLFLQEFIWRTTNYEALS